MDEEKINIFIEPIINKRKNHDLFSYIKIRKIIKKIKKISPNYDTLMEIYNFLILLEKIYMYNNDNNHYLFSATVPKGYDGAFIYQENGFSIKIILRNRDKLITIRLERKLQSKTESNTISFVDGQYEISSKYEEESFIFIIACIMNGLSELVMYYYKNKKF